MKFSNLAKVFFFLLPATLFADVSVDVGKLGESLGGWKKRGDKTAEYSLSGADYRTYKPETTPTPDDGIFISLRIDHVRGWLSSDDHAVLEITVDKEGKIVSAQSSIAIQGRSVTSDLIRGGSLAGSEAVGVDRAVQIGTELIADVSEKLLREKIVEAGRVSFPAALRHNYNLLYQALKTDPIPPAAIVVPNPLDQPSTDNIPEPEVKEPKAPETKIPKEKTPKTDAPKNGKLEIHPYGVVEKAEMGPKQ